ncbi:amino acid ABC transporter permease [Chelatococcus asaccharovorans]|uniref:amino acid ABC transporter permease n=1 Tax=Chelatococcus asaccharovorans TaxID=28210 RepID=UPI00224C6634|nr:amino acid ABC transporter permease [Chelatococcus asaccharovorans]CAH1650120.1 Amino acid ABC transporter membrane protein 1 (PAAT family) [Chelatococcus asaccharovorans]CAH1692056.1 Amino acid ABC transporter membrane protein 1 (PAAT family) [Chelatococcus asaccharovorans]
MMNYHFNFAIVWRYAGKLFDGLLLSLELAAATVAIGMAIGLVLALAELDGPRWLKPLIRAYVEFVRNVPLLLLVYLVFYGVPSAIDLQYDATTSFVATLAIYAGAYLVEILRAGLEAVPKGLIEAGKAIGLTPLGVLVHVRLPTALRIALPSLSNTYVALFKDTSIASAIAVPELAYSMRWIETQTFRTVEVYLVATPIYLLTSYAMLLLLRLAERRYAIAR